MAKVDPNAGLRAILAALEAELARKPAPTQLRAGDLVIPPTSVKVIHGSTQA